ncbi:hypothetical protein AYI68_g2088 [Smittium mucronatum]|uniref:Globin-sensor domain-containing protein n=1 Tax=Smittium mucronatum TaxID=133383 RepID=A0A1R0H3S2_9FUNG|nr:hypothetical protein AYI68_g2088 [Smittium mucronatum]
MLKPMSGIDPKDIPKGEITTSSEPILYRKMMLKKYFNRLMTANYDMGYLKYLDFVARIHPFNPTGEVSIGVDFMHINAMLGYLAGLFTESLLKIDDWDSKTKFDTILAFNKFFYIQCDIFSRYYIPDGSDKGNSVDKIKLEKKEEEIKRLVVESRSSIPSAFGVSSAVGVLAGALFARYLLLK